MNNNLTYDRCAPARVRTRKGSRSAMWAMATACLLAPFSTGCQMGGAAGGAVHHPAFDQLEQGCFGYEPTVWRSMAGDCQQAIRMIPNEVVREPVAPARPVPAEVTTPPTDAAVPEEAILDDVLDSGTPSVPRIVAPPAELPPDAMSPADAPPAVSPSEVPDAPPVDVAPPVEAASEQPVVEPEPAAEAPAAEPEPEAAPEEETPAAANPPVSSARPHLAPIINGPVIRGPIIQTSTSQASADALFRTINEALSETSKPQRIAKRPAAANLSRFISY